MAQEFTINSADIESKINQLLPSQGGFGAGVDFSASTMVIPIVDLTETAEGSALRQDLQSSFGLTSISTFGVTNTTTAIVTTTGYFRCYGVCNLNSDAGSQKSGTFQLTDGTTTKRIIKFDTLGTQTTQANHQTLFDFIVYIGAGDSLQAVSDSAGCSLEGNTRQLADLQGNLINPQ